MLKTEVYQSIFNFFELNHVVVIALPQLLIDIEDNQRGIDHVFGVAYRKTKAGWNESLGSLFICKYKRPCKTLFKSSCRLLTLDDVRIFVDAQDCVE